MAAFLDSREFMVDAEFEWSPAIIRRFHDYANWLTGAFVDADTVPSISLSGSLPLFC